MIDVVISRIRNTYFMIEWLAYSAYVLVGLLIGGVVYREPTLLLLVIPIGIVGVIMRVSFQNIWNMGGQGLWKWVYRGILVIGSSGIYLGLILLFDVHALLLGKLFYRGVQPLPVVVLTSQIVA
jgi:hypothetical protein